MGLTLIPQPRLLVALVGGAVMIALTTLTPVMWVVVLGYHAVVVFLVASDAGRLPRRADFQVSRLLPRPFSLGQVQTVRVGVLSPAAAGLEAEIADHAPAALRPTPRVLHGTFDAEGVLIVQYNTQPERRGAFHLGAVDVRCWRAAGWWRRQVRIPQPEEVAVYPNVVAIRRYQLTLRRGVRIQSGLRRARPPGASTAFAGLRDYLLGDDVRRINWKATARRDRPVVTEVEAERGQQVMLALDCGRLMTAPAGVLTKLDHSVNAALLLAWVAQSQADRVGLLAFSEGVRHFVPPLRGSSQVQQLNRVLYRIQAEYTEPDFGEAFAQLGRRVSRRSLIVVLTDVLDLEASRDLVEHALRLGRRHRVLVVAIADPSVMAARDAPLDRSGRAYEWAAAEELLAARRQSFEALQRGGVLGLDVEAGRLSPALVERYLELKQRALL